MAHKRIMEQLGKVRTAKPVVHHLTNWVTINDCAQVVKSFGASPVMAHAAEEVADMVNIASALVLNIGTLTVELVDAMKRAARRANECGIPVVLDVCGAGATPLRDTKCYELLDSVHIDILKGNASEIARIAGEDVRTKGVDATETGKDLRKVAEELARKRNCTVVITGPADYVTDGRTTLVVTNGTPLMAAVVGTGCMAASVIGAFAAVERDRVIAAAAGLACYEIAAERAAKKAAGPGTFKPLLFDEIHALDEKTVERMLKVGS